MNRAKATNWPVFINSFKRLRASIDCKDPVIFLEHRWLHNSMGRVEFKYNKTELQKQPKLRRGNSFTIIACSYMVIEAIRAIDAIETNYDLKGDLINLRIYNKNYIDEIVESSKKSKNLLIVDTANESLSISHIIYYEISKLKLPINIDILTMPDTPEPTSYYLTKNF